MLKKIILAITLVMLANNGYCSDIDKVKACFLKGDYKSAIAEGEKTLTNYDTHSPDLDELYYVMGLSYLKDGNYLRASDIFEIILREFKNSRFKDEAKLSLGDTYFLKEDYGKAQQQYKELINSNSSTKLKASLYYRLSQVALKKGDTQQGKEYLDKLKAEFPANPEIKLNNDLFSLSDIYYTVQVGSFVNSANANNLCDKLTAKGYDAYVVKVDINAVTSYRVRVGKVKSRIEANELENKLSSEGCPTKIIP